MTHVRRPNRRHIRGLAELLSELCPTTGKRRYLDRRGAASSLAQLVAEDPERDRLRVYQCRPGCGDWHVGHLAGGVR